ncbi:putative Cyclin-dependent kinase 3 [Blattamonas nauphoetae]|uniref:cyclin-dependent kinase n=1 Tax=Blattamonas nauphoetae TaxID=2049346 RepID=A0ABQ9XSN7_9EUKA|nr:putative Cyclin-dependent kinase 3 [Blattamonas nauphoetae]
MSGLERYKKIEKIGEGTYGVVYKASDVLTGRLVAVKKIRLGFGEDGVPVTALREIATQRELQHPNIVKLIETIHTGKQLFLIFEYLPLDLRHCLESSSNEDSQPSFSKQIIKSFAFQLLKGVAYCHSHGIIHRDLKPQNILLDDLGTIKIGDFGLARSFSIPTRAYSHDVVTLWYRPPEILLGSDKYDTSADLWSCGCIIAELFLGRPLFEGDSEIDQLYKIFSILGTPTQELWKGLTSCRYWREEFPKWSQPRLAEILEDVEPSLLDIVQNLLLYNPQNRLTALDALSHPFFDEFAVE